MLLILKPLNSEFSPAKARRRKNNFPNLASLWEILPFLFQYPAPTLVNLFGSLGSADNIAGQGMVLPCKWRGRVNDHTRVGIELAPVRRDGHVNPAAFRVFDDLDAPFGIAARDNRPYHVLNTGHINVIIDHHGEPVHIDAAAALGGDEPGLFRMAEILSLERHDGH
jgi:hypothetical protein